MADENRRELEQEQAATGIVDAGGFEDNAGTGMIAEEQETGAAAQDVAMPSAEEPMAPQDEAQNITPMPTEPIDPETIARPDLHEKESSGIDAAVIVVILLIIIAGISYAFWSSQQAPNTTSKTQQEAAQQMNASSEEPPFEVAELPEGIAAVVNGQEIPETEIDGYVSGFRELYELDTDDRWGEWMASFGYTPQAIRNTAIEVFVEDTIVERAIQDNGVQVTPEQVDEIYAATRNNFDTEEAWQQALAESELTEESFREQCTEQAEKQELMKILAADALSAERIDADVLDYIKTYYPEHADAESLDGIDAEIVDPVREMIEYYAQQTAYSDFITNARETADIKMSEAPKDLPYDLNLLPYYFKNLFSQAQGDQQQQQ